MFVSRRRVVLGLVGLAASLSVHASAAEPQPVVLVVGDSLSAGYGVAVDSTWVALLQKRLAAQGYGYRVVNASISGDTTGGARARLPRALELHKPAVVILELGGNDGLRGLPPAATRTNLLAIVDAARARVPGLPVVLAGMQMPPNMGGEYTRGFREVFPAVARERNAVLVPHLLEGVGGRPEMNLPDGIHPTPAGHEVIASNLWPVLEPVLRRAAEAVGK